MQDLENRFHQLTPPSILGGSDSKESVCNVEDPGSIPGLGRSPGEGNAAHSSILAWEIPWTEGAWWAIVDGVTEELDMN